MSRAEQAYAEALRRIEAWREDEELDLKIEGLDALPPEIGDLTTLERLKVGWQRGRQRLPLSDLSQLAGLARLRHLDCAVTDVSDLSPLTGLAQLRHLDCGFTDVNDLSPLTNFPHLEVLDCGFSKVIDLSPLATLAQLQLLCCRGLRVNDLSPLLQLAHLRYLDVRLCEIETAPQAIWFLPSLEEVEAFRAALPGIPADVLPSDLSINCLPAIHAHLHDLEAGAITGHDGKLLVLGNGLVGKTQLCRRLRGEAYDERIASTHGITVTSAPVADNPEARWNIWDFGGQDLYHGTHALFLKSRAVFVIAWTPAMEGTREHEHGGMSFRNYPLAYWLDYVRQFSGEEAAVVVVQTQCDTRRERRELPPEVRERLTAFAHHEVLEFSARTDRGLDDLQEALAEAYAALDQPPIGRGRAEIRRRLIAWRDKDAARPVAEREHQTLTLAAFEGFCEEVGGISDPSAFLHYLHQTGTVFWQEGLFDDRIVLDQGWALEAIYAVFHRTNTYRQLEYLGGRFRRSLLGDLLWHAEGYSEAEQKLFIDMMLSCSICFRCREADEDGLRQDRADAEDEYIAPDLLPKARPDLAARGLWEPEGEDLSLVWRYGLLPPTLIRNVIADIGNRAGYRATYWRDGVHFFDAETRARAIIEQQMDSDTGWSGRITIRTQDGNAEALLHRLAELLERHDQQLGLASERPERPSQPRRYVLKAEPGHFELKGDDADLRSSKSEDFLPVSEPFANPGRNWYVSYAWADDKTEHGRRREDVVDELCRRAEAHGLVIQRDKNAMTRGDSILAFMQRIGQGDRVFIILSEKYLQSHFCMFELWETWRNCRLDEAEFLQKTRIFVLDDVSIWTIRDRVAWTRHWKAEHDALKPNAGDLGQRDFIAFRNMKEFEHSVGDLLALIADHIQPMTIDELEEHGFEP